MAKNGPEKNGHFFSCGYLHFLFPIALNGTFGGVKKAIVGHVLPVSKDPRKIGTSQLRSKERRAADPAVKERAAVHAAGQEAAAREEILPSPEKLGSNTSLESLVTSPVKDNVREVVEEQPQVVPPDFEDCASNVYDQVRFSN